MIRTANAVLLAMLVAGGPAAFGGSGPVLKSAATAVQLRAAVQERLSLVSDRQWVAFSLAPRRVAPGDRPVSLTTSWNLEPTRTAVVVSAFFEDAGGALTATRSPAERDRIAPGDVWGRASMGPFTSFSGAVSLSGHRMELFRQPLKPGVNDRASRTDELELEIDLTRRALLAAGAYQGELTLVAEAY